MNSRASSVFARGVSSLHGGMQGPSRAALLTSTALALATMLPATRPALAQDATWLANPGSDDFHDANNWTPGLVPTGTATFGTSNTTALTLATPGSVQGWTFEAGASDYTFDITSPLVFEGYGIAIDGGSAAITNHDSLYFWNTSTAGNAVITNNSDLYFNHTSTAGNAAIANNDFLDFYNNSTAGNAAITNNNVLYFHDTSTAGNATIANNYLQLFLDASTAGNATITNNHSLSFYADSTAGNATITNNFAHFFQDASTAGNATIINNNGLNFYNNSTAGNAALINNAGGVVDFSNSTGPNGDGRLSAGSIAGAGTYVLGANELTVGSNDLSTEVSGGISGAGGSLVKTGAGTLTLSGTNSYSGGTVINNGTLQLGTINRAGAVAGTVTLGASSTFDVVNADTSGITSIANGGVTHFRNGASAGHAGINNNGGLVFHDTGTAGSATIANSNYLSFNGSSTAGNAAITNNSEVYFYDTSAAGSATIANTGVLTFYDIGTAGSATVANSNYLTFYDSSTAGSAIITNDRYLAFGRTSTAGSATITNNHSLSFNDGSTAGNAAITNNGDVYFYNTSTAGSSVIANNGGMSFYNTSTAGSATITNNSGGTVDFSISTGPNNDRKLGAGSIAGAGNYVLGANELTVGGNDLSTEVSGVISGAGGSLVKTGTGTLTLSGTNTYSGGTTIAGSTLQLGNGGATGSISGDVVNNGTLAFNRSDAMTFAGSISGTGAVRQIGAGITILTGASTYSGGTTVSDGTLQIGNSGTTGSILGTVTVGSGATFDVVNADTSGITTISNDGVTNFRNGTSAGNANITSNSLLQFSNTSTAGSASIFNTHSLSFSDASTAGHAVITNNDLLNFLDTSTAGNAALINNAGGVVDFSTSTGPNGDGRLSAGSIAGAGSYVLGANELTVGSNDLSTEVSGIISGAGGSLVKTGTGTLTLSGANTYSGGTTIEDGTLQIGNGGTSGSIIGNIVNDGVLAFNRSSLAMTFAGSISGSGAVRQIGPGTTILTGASTYSGGTTIEDGGLQIGNGSATGSILGTIIVGNAAMFDVVNADTSGITAISNDGLVYFRDGTSAGSANIDNRNGLYFRGTSTAGNATITNNNVLYFLDASTAGNAALINNAGGLVDLANGIGPNGDGRLSAGSIAGAGGYFLLGANELTVGSNDLSTEVRSIISGAGGSLVKTGTGTLTLSGANTYSGGTTVSGGTLQIGNGGTSGSITGNIVNDSALAFNRSDATTFAGNISGTGAVRQIGSSTLTLTGAITHTGGTTISDGTLQIGDGGTSGSITGNVVNDSVLAFDRSDAMTFAGNISGTGAVRQIGSGTTILTGASTYSGGTTISGGTLQIGDGGTTGSITGDVVNDGVLAFDRSDATTFAGSITGSGAVRQNGSGTLTLTGASTYGGGTTIAAGTLQIGDGGTTGSILGTVTVDNWANFEVVNADMSGITTISNDGLSHFRNGTSAGSAAITNSSGLYFHGTSTAGDANIINNNTLYFLDTSTAGNASIAGTGTLQFIDNSTAGSASITNNNALHFRDTSTAGSSGITNDNSLRFFDISSAGDAVITNNFSLGFYDASTAGNAALINNAGGVVDFSNSTGPNGDGRLSAGSIAGAGNYVLGANELTIGANDLSTEVSGVISGVGGSLVKTGTGTTILTGANIYSRSTTIAAGTLQIGDGGTSGSVTGNIVNDSVLAFDRSDATTFARSISGSGAVRQIGSGTTILTGSSTYGGGTTIEDGTLQIGNGGTTGSIAGNVVNDSVLAFDRSNAMTFAGSITGSGTVRQIGSGTLTLTGASTYSGGTTISDGTLQIGNGGTSGSITGDVVNNGVLAFDRSDATTFSGSITGTGTVRQIGSGTTILTADNTYSGGTMISAGTLQIGDGGTTGSIAGDVVNDSVLAFDRSDATTFAGDISGTGAVRQNGSGTTILTGASTYSGGTTIAGGRLQFGDGTSGGNNNLGGSINVTDGTLAIQTPATLNVAQTVTFGNNTALSIAAGANSPALSADSITIGNGVAFNISGIADASQLDTVLIDTASGISGDFANVNVGGFGGTVDYLTVATRKSDDSLKYLASYGLSWAAGNNLAHGTFTLTGAADSFTVGTALADQAANPATGWSGTALTKAGAGTLTLTADNTYSGGTTIAGGTLQIGDGGTSGSIVGNVVNDGELAFNRSDATTFAGSISGTGAVRQNGSGTTILTADNTYSGGTTIAGGTLQIGDGGTSGSIAGNVVNDSVLAFDRSDATTFAGSISGTGAVRQIGSSKLILIADNTYSGGTTIAGGALQVGDGGTSGSVTGNVVNDSELAFNRSDAITFAGDISGTGAVRQIGSGTLTLTGASTYSGGTMISAGTLQIGDGGATGSITGNVVNDSVLAFDRSDATTFAGDISGTGAVRQIGSGTLILSGSGTYSGGTTISAGTLQIGDGGATGSITGNVVNDSALAFDRSDATTFAGSISGTGAVRQIGSGTTILTADNTYSGGTTISSGMLQIGDGGTSGSITGNIVNDGVLAFDRSDATTFAGSISGSGTVRQIGSGTTILTADNTYSGGTTISGGTLQVGDGGTSGSVTGNIVNDSVLSFDRSDATTFAGSISGSGAVRQIGSGTTILTGSGTYSGGTMISGGTLQIGDGGTSGSITGNVVNDSVLAFDRSDATTFAGSISGSGAVGQNGSGMLTLTGASTYSGGTTIAAGTLSVSSDVNMGATTGGLTFAGGTLATTAGFDTGRTVSLTQEGRIDVAAGTELGLTGVVSGSSALIKQGSGTLRLDNNANNYGDTLVLAGTVIGNAGSISGHIGNAGTVVFDQAGNASFAGDSAALNNTPGAMIKRGSGVLTLTGLSSLDWAVEAGGLVSSAERFGGHAAVAAGASFTFDQSASATYAGVLSGSGGFSKTGTALLNLTGVSSGFTGTTTVENGILAVNGKLGGSLDVRAGGRLQGAGTVGNTIVSGAIAPGNSIGTLNVAGDITFGMNSVYEVEVDAAGNSDRIVAGGKATIQGGTVGVLAGAGDYTPQTQYTILTANGAGGVAGTFTGVTSNLAFLDPALAYDPNNVYLTMTRNNIDFAGVGLTPNQIATGGGAESLGFGNPVYNAVLNLSAPQAQYAFDQLSGEIHASARTALIEDGRFIRSAVNDRIRAAFDGVGASGMVTTYVDGKPVTVPANTDRLAVWGQGFGSWGSTGGDGNAATLNRKTGGFLMGADAPVFDRWRFGAIAGYSRTDFDVKGRHSSGSGDNFHLGLYGGTAWGDLAFRIGAAYTRHDVSTSRTVSFAGFGNGLKGGYNAATAQVFGELAYGFSMGSTRFEPFANLAYVNLYTDGFTEKGGAAALTSPSTNTDATFTTLGLRASSAFDLGGMSVTAKGMLGWRHAFAGTIAGSAMSFAGGAPFGIGGVPIARNAAVIDLGLDLNPSANSTLGVSYGGQFGSGVADQTFRATFNAKF